MRNKILVFSAFVMTLALCTGCDFFRTLAGRPTSSDIEAMRVELRAREAAEAAAPEFLEPIMKLEITTPPESVGEILGDLNARRGSVLDMDMRGDLQIVHARVPMAQMFGYATAIRSLTKGRASYSMEPDMFELAPKNVRDEILAR